MSLHKYIEQVRSGLQTFDDYGLSEQMDDSADIRPGSQAVLKATVTFIDNSQLYIREFLVGQDHIRHVSYAYQYQKQQEWVEHGCLEQAWGLLLQRYDETLGIDWHWQSADGCIVKAPLGKRTVQGNPQATGANPTDRGKAGSKRHLLTDGQGVPLAVVLTEANRHPPRRWVVEVGHAWFNRFRGVLIRWAKSAPSYLGFVQLAACLIVGRKILIFSG